MSVPLLNLWSLSAHQTHVYEIYTNTSGSDDVETFCYVQYACCSSKNKFFLFILTLKAVFFI